MWKNFSVVCLLFISFVFGQNYDHPRAVIYPPPGLRSNINAPAPDPSFNVFVGSNTAETIQHVNMVTGEVTPFIPLPLGSSDDLTFRSDGTLAWNSLLDFETHVRTPSGEVILVSTVPWPNGIAWSKTGELYMSTDPVGTGIWKLDPTGVNEPINVLNLTVSSMNGFDFGPDNKIYGPLDSNSPGSLVRVDLATGQIDTISTGWTNPEAVRVDDAGNIYAVDDGTATVYLVDPTTGGRTALVTIPEPAYLDNFRLLKDSLIISNSATNAFIQHNLTTNETRYVTPKTPLCLPGGISFYGNILYIADYTVMRSYNTLNGKIDSFARSGPQPSHPDVSFGIYNVYANKDYTIWSCPFDGRVQIRNRIGNAVVGQVPSGFPYGITMTHDRTALLVADYGTGLTVWNGAGYQTGTVLNTGNHVGFTGLVLAEECGYVYAADYDNGAILKVDYNSGAFTVLAENLNAPEGLALDLDSFGGCKIIVAEVGAKRLVSINTETGELTVIAINLPIGGLPAPITLPPPNILTGVAINFEGDIYFTSDFENALYIVPNMEFEHRW